MNFNFTAPKVTVDPAPFNAIGASIREKCNYGNKLNATLKLSNYKLKTILGRKLPDELIPEVCQHVTMMRENGWMTEDDEQWCIANNIK